MIDSASRTPAGRIILALIALTLFWAPLSHARQCDHRAGAALAAVSAVDPAFESATSGEAEDYEEAGHICSCTGCHFHVLIQSGQRTSVVKPSSRPWPDLAVQPAATSQSDLFRPPRV